MIHSVLGVTTRWVPALTPILFDMGRTLDSIPRDVRQLTSRPGFAPFRQEKAAIGRRAIASNRGTTWVLRFAGIGLLSTVAYVLLSLGLRTSLPPQASNAVALLIAATANSWANRRFTLGLAA